MSKTSLEEILNYIRPRVWRAIVLEDNPAFKDAREQFHTREQFTQIVTEELKKRRPRSNRSTAGVTLYQHLELLHLKDTVLSQQLLDDIYVDLQTFELEEILRLRGIKRLSTSNLPIEFHASIVRELYAHILKLQDLRRQHRAPFESCNEHISSCQREISRHFRAIAPLFPLSPLKFSTTSRTKSERDLVPAIYHTLNAAVGAGRGRKQLCISLTALFCSTSPVLSHVYNAEAVRKKLERTKASANPR